jgi:hypothetical protein
MTATDDATLVIPETDVLGQPTGPTKVLQSHWAVLIDGAVNDIPGPHLLAIRDEATARMQWAWWQENRPDTNPRLVRRKITETYGEWEASR